ncbi:MAG: hypothetical protein M0R05_05775 [Bacilli bacterium]|nr:hypothetical protein [Bacilli bacterium]
MSLLVTVYTNEGIIMASDSRTSFSRVQQVLGQRVRVPSGHFYDTVDKTFLAPNNCGISTCGDGSINKIPISGIIKTFIRSQVLATDTVLDTVNKLQSYVRNINTNTDIIFHIFGFDTDSNGNKIMSGYRLITSGQGSIVKINNSSAGASWDGETEIMSRLLKQTFYTNQPQNIPAKAQILLPSNKQIVVQESILIDKANLRVFPEQNIPWDLMSIQDAIEFVEYAIKTTIDTMKFAVVNKTVGGPIDILVITPDGASWVKKKKSY